MVLLALGTLVVAPRPWIAPAWNLGLLWGWLSACALLSLGEIFAAAVLTGSGQEVRSPRLKWLCLWPHFSIDTAEAALGGPGRERLVGLIRVLAPFGGRRSSRVV